MDISCKELNYVKEFVKINFSEPSRREVWPVKHSDLEEGYIQISTPLKNRKGFYVGLSSDDPSEPWVHYEIIDNKIELHLECDKDEERRDEVNKLHTYLKNALLETPYKGKIEWELYCDDSACYGFGYWLDEVINIKNFDKTLKKFIDFFDDLIRKYNDINIKKSISIVKQEKLSLDKQTVVLYDNFALRSVLSLPLAIPDYQRIYCWRKENVICLLEDVFSNIKREKKYKLGSIILHYNNNKDSRKYVYDIIDGQQRLITLAILLYELGVASDLLNASILSNKSNKSKEYVKYNAYLIKEFCKKNINIYSLRDKILDLMEFSVIVLNESAKHKKNSLDLAYTFFSNQNSRGVALSDYDLLKAHHLRWMTGKHEKAKEIDKQVGEFASNWDSMIESEQSNKEKNYERTLDTYLYRLRRWSKNKKCEESEGNHHVKWEYEASSFIEDIPINNKEDRKQYRFNEPIQGGSHFFHFVNYHLEKYSSFIKTKEYITLHENMAGEKSALYYRDVIEGLLFSYYLKFGQKNLSDALSVIMRCVLQHRYNVSSAKMASILQCAFEKDSEISITSELALMIDRGTCSTFFLAEALKFAEGMSSIGMDMKPVQERMLKKVEKISSELEEKISKAFKGINK